MVKTDVEDEEEEVPGEALILLVDFLGGFCSESRSITSGKISPDISRSHCGSDVHTASHET